MNIILKDGSALSLQDGASVMDAAQSISQGLARNVTSALVNGNLTDLRATLQDGDKLELLTASDEKGLWTIRHTASHVLAQAVKKLYPEAKLAIGPAIDTGFYYDFDVEKTFTMDDLAAIEKEMATIIKENIPLTRFTLPRDEAINFMSGKSEPYKVELIRDLPEDAVISFYQQGNFVDLCAGPHLPGTGRVKSFKLLSVAGAYWRGSEKNKMLQRIYGTAFDKKVDLDAYLTRLEEAKKRDHRKLGKELDLFSILDEGPGFPFFHPKGMILRNLLEEFWRQIHTKNGYQEIKTPIMLDKSLWLRSGHWDHYRDNMYTSTIDEREFALKPMNCPGGMLMYQRRIYSYRDLPLKMGELGLVHRHEVSGALHGLMRVRCFTQDDAHIFMTPDQIIEQIIGVINLTDQVYSIFGFPYHVELSTRPENSIGSDTDWEMATQALKTALDAKGMDYKINEGDGAFYGPKIDFHLEDSIGRTWQCGTIQLDFQMPELFDLTYVGPDGEKHRPVMIHRVVFGSIERFIAILTEHFAGAFPMWLSPVQVKILTITQRADAWADVIKEKLLDAGLRVELDQRNEKVGFKIREAQMEKVPYMLVIGDKEVEEGVVSVRSRSEGDQGMMPLDILIEKLLKQVKNKA